MIMLLVFLAAIWVLFGLEYTAITVDFRRENAGIGALIDATLYAILSPSPIKTIFKIYRYY